MEIANLLDVNGLERLALMKLNVSNKLSFDRTAQRVTDLSQQKREETPKRLPETIKLQ